MSKITRDELRTEIAMYESFRDEAQKLGDTGVVEFCCDVLDQLWDDMVRLIREDMLAEDSAYTSDADIRYFESEEGETDCVTGCDPAEYEDEDCEYPSA